MDATCLDSKEGAESLPGPLGAKYDDSEETLTVTLAIPGIKKPPFFGWFGGGNTSVAITAKEESVRVLVEILKKKRGAGKEDKVEKVLWLVRQLPEKIEPESFSWKLRDNQVVLSLKKAVPGSWQRTLDQYGIDVADV